MILIETNHSGNENSDVEGGVVTDSGKRQQSEMVGGGLKALGFHILMLNFASATFKWHTSERMIRTAGSSSDPDFRATDDMFKALSSESIQSITNNHLPILIHTREKVG